ncbi:MAG: NAD-dependent deacylase [Rhodospirillales bacterium]|nr:NAD-dependent deacylase [Rhodospirillales bacterium]
MKRIVILTGAGISKESGLDTFRDADGLWSKVRIEDVATPEAFLRDPVRVHDFYNQRRRQMVGGNIRPNAAHIALAKLEEEGAKRQIEVLVVTQNIDDLHEKAGSRNLLHMHGEMKKVRCESCDHVVAWEEDLTLETPCPACARPGGMRPHVVWFGEMPLYMDQIMQALERFDLFLSFGSSVNVYPAAGFVRQVRRAGRAHTVELNLEPSEGVELFAEILHGPASRIVPDYVERILGGSP